MGHQTVDEYDASGNRTARWESVGEGTGGEGRWIATRYAYDARGQLVKATDPAGNETRYERDAEGRVVRQVDPDLGTRSARYDIEGRVVEEVDGNGERTTMDYDALDRPIVRTLRAGRPDAETHRFEYDDVDTGGAALGRLTRTTYGPGNSERWHYDAAGRIGVSTGMSVRSMASCTPSSTRTTPRATSYGPAIRMVTTTRVIPVFHGRSTRPAG
jgi:YD repeat-containing protein